MILNLTQHLATAEQIEAGVTEAPCDLTDLLTFTHIPRPEDITSRARQIADIAASSGATKAMIGGAPYLMGALESALHKLGITPLYAFSLRESIEVQENGVTVKRSVFRHIGFIQSCQADN